MKKTLGTIIMAAMTTSLLGQTALATKLTAIGPAEGQVNIVAWPGYIERGETDANFDWVTGFEEATGCKVQVKTANTSDEMVALMNEGGFDLVTASGDASLRLIAGKRVQEINNRSHSQLERRRRPPEGGAVAHGRRQALRHALYVGTECAHVQHRSVQGAANQLERRV